MKSTLIIAILALMLMAYFLLGCSPRLEPVKGLQVTVRVVSPEWIREQATKPDSHVSSSGALAFFDRSTCTEYLPSGVSRERFNELLIHETRHALGDEHDADQNWLSPQPGLNEALQAKCVNRSLAKE